MFKFISLNFYRAIIGCLFFSGCIASYATKKKRYTDSIEYKNGETDNTVSLKKTFL